MAFMAFMVKDQWHQLIKFEWTYRIDLLAASVLAITIIFILDAFGWHLILRALGQRLPASESIYIWMISSLTRYLPGAVWSYLSRVSLASAHGLRKTSTALSLYIEILLMVSSAILIGLPALLRTADISSTLPSLLVAFALFSALLHPYSIGLLRYIPGRIGQIVKQIALPDAKRIFALFCYYILLWLLFAAAFALFASAIHPLSSDQWLPVAQSLPLAFAAGFVMVIFPGGIGVREAALYFLLLPIVPEPVALLISLGSRVWIMAGEMLALTIAWLLRSNGTRQITR